jgi:hypothetical protein
MTADARAVGPVRFSGRRIACRPASAAMLSVRSLPITSKATLARVAVDARAAEVGLQQQRGRFREPLTVLLVQEAVPTFAAKAVARPPVSRRATQ